MSEKITIESEVNGVKYLDVSFLIPVVDGQIYLGQRNTEPYKGFYGAIGGKAEAGLKNYIGEEHLIEKMGGHKALSIADQFSLNRGYELLSETAVREFCEEMFFDKSYPQDFSKKDFTNIYRLGSIVDHPKQPLSTNPFIFDKSLETHCYFHMSQVNRKDFNPSPREISDFIPLTNINTKKVFPITMMALEHLKWWIDMGFAKYDDNLKNYDLENIKFQIPDFDIPATAYRHTGMTGAVMYFSERKRLPWQKQI